MKTIALKLGMVPMLVLGMTACSFTRTTQSIEHNRSLDKLKASVCSICRDSTRAFPSVSDIRYLLAMDDSLCTIAMYSEDTDSVLSATKTLALQVVVSIITNGLIKDPRYFHPIVSEGDRMQLEYHAIEALKLSKQ